jgi:hypothetical protein
MEAVTQRSTVATIAGRTSEAPAPVPPAAVPRVEPKPAEPEAEVLAPPATSVISKRGSSRWVVLGKNTKSSFYWPFLPLGLAGLACCRRQGGRWVDLLPLFGIAAVCFAPSILSCFVGSQPRLSPRYFLPGIPFLLPWVAAGFLAGWDLLNAPVAASSSKGTWLRAWGPQLVLLIVILVKSLGLRRADEWTYIEAGTWLRRQTMPAPRHVLDSSEKTAFYGGCMLPIAFPPPWEGPRWIRSGNAWHPGDPSDPAASVSNSVRWTFDVVRQNNLGYLILDEYRLRRYPPEYRKELELMGFQLMAAFEKGGRSEGIGVWIYRLPGPGR